MVRVNLISHLTAFAMPGKFFLSQHLPVENKKFTFAWTIVRQIPRHWFSHTVSFTCTMMTLKIIMSEGGFFLIEYGVLNLI